MASLFPVPCHGMVFGPSRQAPKSRKWPPDKNIGSDYAFGSCSRSRSGSRSRSRSSSTSSS
eukprot:6373465-Pyramimonas_sp.AAC.1